MQTMLSIIVCLLLLSTTASAEVKKWGTIKNGSNSKVGDYEFYNDGISSHTIDNYKFYSDGTSEQTLGDYTVDSTRGSSHQIGGHTFRSDGCDGQVIGDYHFYDGGSISTLGDYKFRSGEWGVCVQRVRSHTIGFDLLKEIVHMHHGGQVNGR